MQNALDDVITLEEASVFFEKHEAIANADLKQYMVRSIWEIDGNRKDYMELLELLRTQCSQENLIEYINA